MGPYLLGALAGKDTTNPLKKGFELERAFLHRANLDLSGASQGDGAGGDWADLFSSGFHVPLSRLLEHAPRLRSSLPRASDPRQRRHARKNSRRKSRAGHVFAKTGTFGSEDSLNGKMMLNGKGLAGYVITKSGRKLAFAAYVNHVSLPPDPDAAQDVAGQALGEIAASAYDSGL